MKKIIYWDYAFWIFIYAIVFLSIGITIGKLLEKYMPKLDEKKYRTLTLIEIYVQVGIIAVLTYIMREYVDVLFKMFFTIKKRPDRFAVLIVAPTLFGQMPTLMDKLHHIWSL
tara:strand:+ start:51 stop:389 length:339 start_codon:yes stop_codon:yes gene_type:complete